jgi:hypothetical protein
MADTSKCNNTRSDTPYHPFTASLNPRCSSCSSLHLEFQQHRLAQSTSTWSLIPTTWRHDLRSRAYSLIILDIWEQRPMTLTGLWAFLLAYPFPTLLIAYPRIISCPPFSQKATLAKLHLGAWLQGLWLILSTSVLEGYWPEVKQQVGHSVRRSMASRPTHPPEAGKWFRIWAVEV